MTATTPQTTDFSRDILGRYVCNGFDEAMKSMDQNLYADARPFDIVVVGGGTFGSVISSHFFNRDKAHSHRILVLEAGQFALPEHAQNFPLINPSEVWGVPWNSDSPKSWNQQFPGLAFCIGGRSLFWGGWSPYFIDSELASPDWPSTVIKDLMTNVLTINGRQMSYLDHAAEQIGSANTEDFIYTEKDKDKKDIGLHSTLRNQLFTFLKKRHSNGTELTGNRGTSMSAATNEKLLKKELEAPLAVQSSSPRPGFFPFNKFSSVPLLIEASRTAQVQAEQATAFGDLQAANVKKRLMVVDNTHVIRLERSGSRITKVITNQGEIIVPENGIVILGLGTIENTRIALNTLPNVNGLIGKNLMAHLRSNVTFRIQRSSFSSLDVTKHPELKDLEVSALFVKGIHSHDDGTKGHFHIQITASGVGDLTTDSESELFKKLPDIDMLDRFRGMDDRWIVVTLRGIGEMIGDKTSADPVNRITLGGSQGNFDFGVPRASIRLDVPENSKDFQLWEAMDAVSDELAIGLANGGTIQYLVGGVWGDVKPNASQRRDKLSSTHHESGTLWMGNDPNSSVTDSWGKFHESDNLYAVGPCLLPTMGSPNPMLSGVALSRRTADHLVSPKPFVADAGFIALFDGLNTDGWKMSTIENQQGQSNPGKFNIVDGSLQSEPGNDIGLFWNVQPLPADFILRLEWKRTREDDNSGVFLRFPDPRSKGYNNTAWVAVDFGFEVQIDETGSPDGSPIHKTGSVYAQSQQTLTQQAAKPVGQWNLYEIQVKGQNYIVHLNGIQVTEFNNLNLNKGISSSVSSPSYFGLQSHTGKVAFRNIQVKAL